MIVSAEMRWFWATACPDQFDAWFRSGSPSPGAGCREDEYLHERGQTELEIQATRRNAGCRNKRPRRRSARIPRSCAFVGEAQIWCKWPSSALTLGDLPTVKTKKQRWLRKFDMTGAEPVEMRMAKDEAPADHRPLPHEGCNIELTRIELEQKQVWWTLGVSRRSANCLRSNETCAPPFPSWPLAARPHLRQGIC